jgi:predicted dehydrogenase
MGTQRRNFPAIREGIEKLQAGEIGRILFSRGWYNARRPSIGKGKEAPIPSWLDYALWQGPAPERPYRDNVLHYNWHWFWHWGTGELGNNGVHALDVCRWGLGVDYPTRVTSGGGKLRHDDDQETPDTHVVTYEFEGGRAITWEGLSWSPHGLDGEQFGMTFHGDKGTMAMLGNGYKIYDLQNKEIAAQDGSGDEAPHLAHFLDCIRTGGRSRADIEEGHKSTLLCHLGNISQRVGRALNLDPKNGHIQHDADAQALWGREYQPEWEPKV